MLILLAFVAATLELGTNLNTLLVPLVAVIVLYAQSRISKKTTDRVSEIHMLVDGRMSEAITRIQQLEASLKTSDTPVPAAAPPTPTHELLHPETPSP